MGKKRAGERETEEQEKAAAGTPDAKKRRNGSPTTDGVSGPGAAVLCDDVVGNILARVPARTAVASMALSRRHRRLIRSPEFRSLHRWLAPPLPRPHIAYLVTATVRMRPAGKDEVPASAFQGFHVAGASGFNGNDPMPMRALAGPRFSDVGYVNTCNGIVLLAGDKYSAQSRCILWNPAVADVVAEVSVPGADADASTHVKEYRALGLGYSQRSKTYKLILLSGCRKEAEAARRRRGHRSFAAGRKDGTVYFSLVTYALADLGKQPTQIELPAVRGNVAISQHSLYMDGKIYLLLSHSKTNPAAILAFDVDDETVTSIDLPIEQDPLGYTSGLMELSARPCVVTDYGGGCALWLLSVDHRWQRRCLIGEPRSGHRIYPDSIVGAWDCGGLLVLCYRDDLYNADRLFLHDLTTGKMFMPNLESVVTLKCSESSNLAFCWGYRPTLEAPSSVVGKLNKDKDDGCRECSTYIMKALKPVAEQDRRKGQEATLNTVCFMDFLVRIMQKLPEDMQQVLEMKMPDSDDPDFTFENVLFDD
jgi:F-box interacting protein